VAGERPRRGLLVDWGGVLTTNLFTGFAAFCEREGLAPHAVALAFRDDEGARRALVDFECGRLPLEEFQPRLAAVLGVREHDRLVERLFADMRADEAMVEAVAAARRAGVRTGLLSNSWGAESYDRSRFDELFDVLVISGEEGIRKPESAIYALAAERIGLPPEELVFVDDLEQNLAPAERLGMATVHHTDAAASIAQLEELLGVALGG
jgi:epoxide hydrolase-like predicted phosphatase